MQQWNVVVSTSGAYNLAKDLLQEFGSVHRTDFYNVLVLEVPDIHEFLGQLHQRVAAEPSLRDILGHVIPVTTTFLFQTPEEFETKARETVISWLPQLANNSFHVRMHRRGFRGRLSSHHEERFLDEFLLQQLEEAGTPGQIIFEDPDAIIAVETVAQRAGLSLWTREDLQRYSLLKLD
ncbi:conserved hypothetical protein [Nitrosococcus halophilus Nc 4]|uniref:THUMP domain-containing protein n=1 Tax=Nitrosococcus halophilus (strain Nc4) TaxID=472759 RepID=D5C3N1_NITHN|nr:hypothetical protein [Nitrosococcus halophilus]ADE15003.1 conserved hypothetical protein [Nitrosococcus halophilus Nc 4]